MRKLGKATETATKIVAVLVGGKRKRERESARKNDIMAAANGNRQMAEGVEGGARVRAS